MGDAVVQTDVDRLLALVERRGEISFDEASKILSIPFKVIESLSGLLEEEDVLHIVYKFTTPYIVQGKLEKGKKYAKKKPKTQKEIMEAAQKGIIKKEPKIEGEAPANVESFSESKELEPEDKEEGSGEKEESSIPASELERREQLEAKKDEPMIKTAADINAEAAEGIEAEELTDMVNETKSLAEQGKIEEARELFLEIKKKKADLSKEHIETEKKLRGDIAKLNDYLILGLDKALTTDFSRKYDHLNTQLQKAWTYVKNGTISSLLELKEVENLYEDIRKTYFELPEGFMDKRVNIQNQMLELYRVMIANKKRLYTEEFKTKALQIQDMIKNAYMQAQSKNIKEASELFKKINKGYAELPEGFLKQKTELQTQILKLYQKLISGAEIFFENKVDKEKQAIDSLLKKAYASVHNKDAVNARKFYDDAIEEYAKFPKGFLNIRAKFEEQLLELHRLTSLLENRKLLDEASRTVEDIKHYLESANAYMDSGEYSLAQMEYDKLTELYNELPRGMQGSDQLRDDIIQLHNRLLPKMLKTEATDSETRTYNQLTKHMLKIHEHIRKREFDKIKPEYFETYRMYHELPLRFLNKKTGIYAELQRVYQELRLYSEAKKLEEYAQNKDYTKLRKSLEYIHKNHPGLASKYKNDKELFDFVKEKYLIYSELLKKYMHGQKEEHNEVKQKLEKIAEKKDIKDVKVPAEAFDVPENPEKGNPSQEIKKEKLQIKDLDINVPKQA